MKTLVACAVLAITGTAWACPPPPPMRPQLTLVTAAGATIPGDGGLVVRTTMEPDYDRTGGGAATLSVRDAGGAALTPEVDDYADGIARWRFPTTAARDLEVLDGDGKVVATIHQAPARRGALPAPRIKRLTSTARRERDNAAKAYGVPGSHMVLDLAAAAPAGATLIAEMPDGGAWFAATPTGRRIVRDTYGGKGCSGGPAPVLAGTRLRFAWLDAAGRRSPWSRPLTVAFARAP